MAERACRGEEKGRRERKGGEKKRRGEKKEEKKKEEEKIKEEKKNALPGIPFAWKVTVDRPRLLIACTYYTDIYRESRLT